MPVRRIRAAEWARWRDWRYAMLQEAPYAFGSTYAEALARTDEEWIDRTADLADGDSCYVVAEADDTWLAGAGGYVEDGIPNVFGVWTRPEARGLGYADACVRAVVEWARRLGHTEIRLWATDGNTAAARVYERIGFVRNGTTQPLPSDPTKVESEYTLPL